MFKLWNVGKLWNISFIFKELLEKERKQREKWKGQPLLEISSCFTIYSEPIWFPENFVPSPSQDIFVCFLWLGKKQTLLQSFNFFIP